MIRFVWAARALPIRPRNYPMDLLAELRRKIETFDTDHIMSGISAAIRHIEVGERYLHRGRSDEDQ